MGNVVSGAPRPGQPRGRCSAETRFPGRQRDRGGSRVASAGPLPRAGHAGNCSPAVSGSVQPSFPSAPRAAAPQGLPGPGPTLRGLGPVLGAAWGLRPGGIGAGVRWGAGAGRGPWPLCGGARGRGAGISRPGAAPAVTVLRPEGVRRWPGRFCCCEIPWSH